MHTTSLARTASVLLFSAATCLLAIGCSKDDEAAEAGVAEAPSNENVNLPPVPELPLLDIPREYDDGSLSVIGLMIERDKHMLEEVTLSAMVVEIYECDEADPKVKKGKEESEDGLVEGCQYPHVYIADTPDSPKRLLVTGYDAQHYEPQLQETTRYRFKGTYSIQASGFSSSENGLLIADSIEGSGLEQPEEDEE